MLSSPPLGGCSHTESADEDVWISTEGPFWQGVIPNCCAPKTPYDWLIDSKQIIILKIFT